MDEARESPLDLSPRDINCNECLQDTASRYGLEFFSFIL
jgi:hypothetical protein